MFLNSGTTRSFIFLILLFQVCIHYTPAYSIQLNLWILVFTLQLPPTTFSHFYLPFVSILYHAPISLFSPSFFFLSVYLIWIS